MEPGTMLDGRYRVGDILVEPPPTTIYRGETTDGAQSVVIQALTLVDRRPDGAGPRVDQLHRRLEAGKSAIDGASQPPFAPPLAVDLTDRRTPYLVYLANHLSASELQGHLSRRLRGLLEASGAITPSLKKFLDELAAPNGAPHPTESPDPAPRGDVDGAGPGAESQHATIDATDGVESVDVPADDVVPEQATLDATDRVESVDAPADDVIPEEPTRETSPDSDSTDGPADDVIPEGPTRETSGDVDSMDLPAEDFEVAAVPSDDNGRDDSADVPADDLAPANAHRDHGGAERGEGSVDDAPTDLIDLDGVEESDRANAPTQRVDLEDADDNRDEPDAEPEDSDLVDAKPDARPDPESSPEQQSDSPPSSSPNKPADEDFRTGRWEDVVRGTVEKLTLPDDDEDDDDQGLDRERMVSMAVIFGAVVGVLLFVILSVLLLIVTFG